MLKLFLSIIWPTVYFKSNSSGMRSLSQYSIYMKYVSYLTWKSKATNVANTFTYSHVSSYFDNSLIIHSLFEIEKHVIKRITGWKTISTKSFVQIDLQQLKLWSLNPCAENPPEKIGKPLKTSFLRWSKMHLRFEQFTFILQKSCR